MKPGKNTDQIENENCSCTSCVYRSASDRPSLKRFIAKGSRIDRLYYGKYIPLRERKLLERLVRTRGVYDDIRAQLISDSTISSNKPDLNPEKRLPAKELYKENNSSAVLELINLIDKGADLGSKKLSDCCSCCSCSSKIHVHEHVKKTHRFRRGHAGGRAYEYGYVKEKTGGEYRKKRGVRFKSKHIRSDPCFCTLKFSGLIKNQSKSLLRKLRRDHSVPALEITQTTEENVKKNNKLQELSRASYEKVREANTRIKELVSEGARRARESKNIIGENIHANTKRSLEKIKVAKDKITQNIKTGIRKASISRTDKERDLLMSCLCPEKELFFKIKKDSVSKFKDDLKKKQLMKYWECEPECIEETCVPEECLKKIKLKNSRRTKSRRKYGDITKQDRKIGDLLNKSDARIQSQSQLVNTKMGTERQTKNLYADRKQEIVKPQLSFETNSKKKAVMPKVEISLKKNKDNICECDNITLPKKQDAMHTKMQVIKTVLPPPEISSPIGGKPVKKQDNNKLISNVIKQERPEKRSNDNDKIRIMKSPVIVKTQPDNKQSHRQAVRIGSSFSFNVEFYKERSSSNVSRTESTYRKKKNQPEQRQKRKEGRGKRPKRRRQRGSQVKLDGYPKNTQSGSHALKRCFCTLKLKPKKNKQKIKTIGKGTSTAESSSSGAFRKDFECKKEMCKKEPSRCIDQLCDFMEHANAKRRHNRSNEIGTNTVLKTKKVLKLSKSGKRKKKERQLLPYECDPGVCVPGDCNPEECLKLINKRERKKKLKDTASGSYQCSCKTKSTSSFASKSITPLKVKTVQSNATTSPNSIPKMSREFIQRPQKISEHKNRQAVRIGSSFSFNIEFYKAKMPAISTPTNVKSITFKPKVKQQNRPKERSVHKKKSKPTQINKKERNAHIGTTLKRCFCTLKLQKKEYTKRKNKMLSIGTDTINPGYLTIEMSTKGTKINRKDRNLLDPFECEPFTCIPGACDPYKCLERINKRNMRLKNIGLTTTSPIMITETSSTEIEKTSKPIQIKLEKPSKSHKTLTKPYFAKKYIKKEKQLGSGDSSIKTRNAVKLGSTFSFDVQFYKNEYFPTERAYKYEVDEKPFKRNTNIKLKDKGIKNKVSNLSHVDTQVKVKGRNKASLVTPMLKKCFCTLNLVKKQNKQYRKTDLRNKTSPIVYTVNKVITANTFASCMDSTIHKNIRSSTFCNKFCAKYINLETASSNSKTTYDVKPHGLVKVGKLYSEVSVTLEHTNKKSESLEKYLMNRKAVKSHEGFLTQTLNINKREKVQGNICEKQNNYTPEVTGLHRYLRQYYYTMNVQTRNIQMLSKRNKPLQTGRSNRENQYNSRKLEPYECEPGICVPGECNPYDCQKLILERMKRHTSKKLGTTSTSRTTSSYTGNNRLNFGSNKTQNTERSITNQLKRKIPESANKHSNKQAIRLGSSFSFDIEFFKDNSNISKGWIEPKYSSDTKLARRVRQRHKRFKTASTRGQEISSIDQQSQSGSLMADKASHALPDRKRCFCTLKLQKKGRLYKEHAKKDKITNIHKDPNNTHVTMSTRGQNTAKIKQVKVKRKLDPYECEPGICVPGYCDPYKCLEIMKLKKTEGQQLGTNTVYTSNSVSSMTIPAQNRYRDRAVSVNTKQRIDKPISIRKHTDNKDTSRQCVRIGSSFSFNVEFYKDNPTALRHEEKARNITHEKMSRPVLNKKNVREKGSQNYKDLKHMNSQIKNSPLNASTMTKSLLKRCFCTAQLRAPNATKQSQIEQPLTFKKRCMCVLNLLKQSKLSHRPATVELPKPLMASKKVNTRNIKDSRPLEPYECFPGICIPGECDPYKCYEIMNKRKTDTYSRASETSTFKTRPAASHTSDVLTRDRRTQPMRTKARAHTKKKLHTKTPHEHNTNKQAVKIGSNFSFNIEFFKQNTSDFNGTATSNLEKYESIKPNRVKLRKPKIKSAGANARSVTYSTTRTQASGVRKENRSISAKPLLKRCFCVLKLQNQRKKDNKNTDVNIMESNLKKMDTKSVMTVEKINWHLNKLEPYECEPNVCVPYQCDPTECEKLIKKRLNQQRNGTIAAQLGEPARNIKWRSDKLLPYECEPNVCIPYECDPNECKKRIQERLNRERHRESGTSTNLRRITRASITDKVFGPKMKNQHTLNKSHASHKRQSIGVTKNESLEHPSRQSVKIGSSFTFNIEFYKNKDGIDVVKLPKSDDVRSVKPHFKVNKNIQKQMKKRGSQKIQDKRRSKLIQFENDIRKSQATMTNVSPFSNRCFCTLYVRKPKKEKFPTINDRRVTVTSDASTETNKPHKLKLLPYECEPQSCIPGDCNPLECLERIKNRENYRKNVGLTTTRYTKSIGSAVSAVSAKTRNKNLQTKNTAVKKNVESKSKEIKGLTLESNPRQVVRIGSNFSFDLEFYKDRIIDNNLNNLTSSQSEIRRLPSDNKTTQDFSSTRHINTQVLRNATKSAKSGISSVWKRCFCTLKLQKDPKYMKKNSNSCSKKTNFSRNEGNMTKCDQMSLNTRTSGLVPFLKKCFCDLKFHMTPDNQQKRDLEKNKKLNTQTNANTFQTTNLHLDPYECEPGVCVPGLCNPYECEKRIQKRFLRALSTQTKRTTKNFATNPTYNNKHNSVTIQSKAEKINKLKQKKEILRPEYTQESLFVDNVTNRQAVHIGSNFGFNIEFFKDSANPDLTMLPQDKSTTKSKLPKVSLNDKKNQFKYKTVPQHKASQSAHGNRKSKSSSIVPLLQRCFCTLKLNKSQKRAYEINTKKPILKSQSVATHNQTILPKQIPMNIQNLEPYECEPFICIPGECDPYECEKRIKIRNQAQKSQTTETQLMKYHPKSVGVSGRTLKTQKTQSDLPDPVGGLKSSIEAKEQPRFVEVPRFSNLTNNNIVRIGSNFNFNIEFYKETIPQTVIVNTQDEKQRNIQNVDQISRNPKYALDKKVLVKGYHMENRKLQNYDIKTYEKGSDTGNKLKRCFCTLKLQKNATKKDISKELRDKTVYPVLIKHKYPQVFDVRRVTVQKTPKYVTNSKLSEVKSAGTKVSKKFLKQCVCQDRRNINVNEMHTILPYVPSKFNKKVSKTILATYDKHKGVSSITSKPNKLSMDKVRKLTKKKSYKSINKSRNKSVLTRPLETENINRKSFLHRLFCKCSNNYNHTTNITNAANPPCDLETCNFQKQNNINSRNISKNKIDLKVSKSVRQHKSLSGSGTTKKSKSLKVLKKEEKIQRIPSMRQGEIYSSDLDRCPRSSINKSQAGPYDFRENSTLGNINNRSQKQVKSTILKHGKCNDTLCSNCEMQFKKKVHFQDSSSVHKQRINKKILNKSNEKYKLPSRTTKSRSLRSNNKQLKDSQNFSKSCNYCDLCGSRVDKEEIQKAAGDRRQSKLAIQKMNNFLTATTDKIKNLFIYDDNDNICSGENDIQPLFEMKLDSQNYGIINKDEVIHSVTMLTNKMKRDQAKSKREQLLHGKSCRCCICLGKKHKGGANIKVSAKGSKATGLFGNMFGGESTRSSKTAPDKPCVCGSEVCAKELINMSNERQSKKQKRRWKPCACGSPICKHESHMMKILSTTPDKIMCHCMEEMAKRNAIIKKAELKEEAKKRAIRLDKYKKEDAIRKKRRMKENLIEEKSVKENAKETDSDLLLMAESLLDIAKLGFTATSDTVRCAARTAMDPKGAYTSLTTLKDHPAHFFKGAKNAVTDSGVASTLRRLKFRWGAMRAVTDVKNIMEEHRLTNFLLHITDKNADRRSGRVKKRVRERFDFNCSLYMATLRKRPCLCLYDRCPAFYPHFMAALNVWRQFSDIVLFLIAVVVWSPCILAMELCRAMMCCFLCTG